MLFLSKIIALGTKHQTFSTVAKVRLMNIVSLITIVISAGYSLNYLLVLNQPLVAIINTGFMFAYAISFIFMHFL